MKIFILLLAISLFGMQTAHAQNNPKPDQLLRHVVLFKFKDTASAAGVKQVEDAFYALKGKISLIRDFEWGTNNSPENSNQGFTHCFFASFASEKDRDDYLVHPDHKAFVQVLLPYLDKALVVDYWAKR